jgi:hypothetical protein
MNTRALSTLLLTALAAASLTHAQETSSLEEAQKAARKVNAALPALTGAPLAIDADLDKPHLIKADGRGAMIVPDRKFTAENLATLGTGITPVGQLWMLRAGIVRDGRLTPAEDLRTVSVTDGDKSMSVQIYLLGARKNAQGTPELVLFAKGDKPLLTAALTGDSAGTQTLPVEITGRKTSDDTATIDIHLFGRQHAELSLAKSE